jgi:peroxiredoxin
MNITGPIAPPLIVSQWLNTKGSIPLEQLRGRVVALIAFQMLCPGCVSHSLPQAQKIRAAFAESELVVLGLHTVFEHHAMMGPEALKAFIHEYGLTFPIGIDQTDSRSEIPLTMQRYRMRGTPTLILLDQLGRLRMQHFGRLDDVQLGAYIGGLLAESSTDVAHGAMDDTMAAPTMTAEPVSAIAVACEADQCKLP